MFRGTRNTLAVGWITCSLIFIAGLLELLHGGLGKSWWDGAWALVTQPMFWMGVGLAALWTVPPMLKWSALLSGRFHTFLPWALSAPYWQLLIYNLGDAGAWLAGLHVLSAMFFGMAVGVTLIVLTLSLLKVRPARVLGVYGFHSPDLSFVFNKKDKTLRMKWKQDMQDFPLHAFYVQSHPQYIERERSYTETKFGTVYGSNGTIGHVTTTGPTHSYTAKVSTGLWNTTIGTQEHKVHTSLSGRELKELENIEKAILDARSKAHDANQEAKVQAERDAQQKAQADRQEKIGSWLSNHGVKNGDFYHYQLASNGLPYFCVFTDIQGQGGFYHYVGVGKPQADHNGWISWKGSWKGAKIVPAKPGELLVEVVDQSYEAQHLAKRTLLIALDNSVLINEWRTRIEKVSQF